MGSKAENDYTHQKVHVLTFSENVLACEQLLSDTLLRPEMVQQIGATLLTIHHVALTQVSQHITISATFKDFQFCKYTTRFATT